MKFLMARNDLCDLVNSVQNIVALRTPMPILNNILVDASDSKVTLTATDLTVGIRCTASAKVLEPGATTVPARRFAQLLKELGVSYIEVSANDREVSQVVADSATFRLHGMPKADFPALPDLSGAQRVIVKQRDLKDGLFRTAFAVSLEENRYTLTGVSMQVSETGALFVGTDGKRLARMVIPVQAEGRLSYHCIIPAKAVAELAKNLSDDDESATLYLLPDKVAVESNNRLVLTKLLSGEYPDVERVVPTQSVAVVAIHREELGSLLRQVSLFITETYNSVRCSIHEGSLQLAANAADIGEGRVSMNVNYSGPRFDIAFNPVHFLDILRHTRGEFIYMGFQDSFNPMILSDVEFGTTTEQFPSPLFILMPLRLNSGSTSSQKTS
jgi:DNA polymerase-3 subunit beta